MVLTYRPPASPAKENPQELVFCKLWIISHVDCKLLRLEAAWKFGNLVLLGKSWQCDEVVAVMRLSPLSDVSSLYALPNLTVSQCLWLISPLIRHILIPLSPALPLSFHLTYPSPRPSVIPLSLGKTGFKGEREVRGGGDVKKTCSLIRKSKSWSGGYSWVFDCL